MDHQTLRQAARDSLDKAPYNPKKLALIHTGAALLLSLLMAVVSFLLTKSYNAAVGLSKLNQRAVLETIQTVLSFVNMIVTPMWSIGFLAVALRTARWSNAEPRDLLDGFRNWGAVLRLYILHACLIFVLIFACSQIASLLFSFFPQSRVLTQAMYAAMESGQDPVAAAEQLSPSTVLPLFLLLLATFAVVGIPLFYRFRLSFFAVAEGERSARKAMALSAFLMRDNRMSMFRLDLRFWWYYGALLLLSALGSVDLFLSLTGVTLPFSRDILIYGGTGLYLVGTLLVNWQFSMSVRTTYAHCYEELKAQQLPPEPEIKSDPGANPWIQNEE